jgi:hypothetical protein
MKYYVIYSFIVLLTVNSACKRTEKSAVPNEPGNTTEDPLPSWNEGPLKREIIAYVTKVTTATSGGLIPAAERIATFDNDGTLWAERPYVQELFIKYMAKRMMKETPSLVNRQPFKALASQDKDYFKNGGEKAMLQLLTATHTGMTEEEFENAVADFFATATYPKGTVSIPITQIVYQPQLELLNYLRRHGFKVFICTGGTAEFVRSVSEQFYAIPKEQVIGTFFRYRFEDNGNRIIREPAIAVFNDKQGKPVSIQQHIGQRPVFACGNEGGQGDIAMLRFSQGSKYPSFQLLINHTDSIREFFYQENDSASLHAAAKNNWFVVDIKSDWKTVFVPKR